MKKIKIAYWITTVLLSLMMLMSASMYILKHETIKEAFTTLGFPTYIIYPLALAKILGVLAITTRKSQLLKEWAYAGFFYNFLLAFSAHISIGDGKFTGALIALVLLISSYSLEKKSFAEENREQ